MLDLKSWVPRASLSAQGGVGVVGNETALGCASATRGNDAIVQCILFEDLYITWYQMV